MGKNRDRDASSAFNQDVGMPRRKLLKGVANRVQVDQTILDDRRSIWCDRCPVPYRVDEILGCAGATRFKELADVIVVTRTDRLHPDTIDPCGSRESKHPTG